MAKKDVVDEKEILNGEATWQQLSDGTTNVIWAEGATRPQVIPNKKAD